MASTIDPKVAIQYAMLVQKAEAVPPGQTVYNPGDTINVLYDAISINYTVVTTFYGNDLATDANRARALAIVSFGFVAQDAVGNVVIAIRGTDGIFEWLQDARFLLVKCPFLPGAGFTEDGFTDVYESLRIAKDTASPRLVDALPNLAFPHPATSLTICGHSLGGALVTLLALDVAANTKFKSPVAYTYASPRAGDPSFANTYDQVVPHTIRIANRLDLVPKLPMPPLYAHVLQLYELNPLLRVKFDILCQHHLTTYLYLLSLQASGTPLPLNPECVPPRLPIPV
jgi:pimeloyl-ACP methyl ester carboxylesterase